MTLILSILRCPDAVPPETKRVSGGEFRIGRGPDNDWIMPDPDRLLSKKHCVVAFRNGGWAIADTSTNGTFLNRDSEPIGPGQIRGLSDGDRIRFGAYEIEARLEDEAAFGRPAQGGYGAPKASPFSDPFGDDVFAPKQAPAETFTSSAFGNDPLFGGPSPSQSVTMPVNYDPLAPNLDDDDFFAAPTQADHSQSFSDAFKPPPVAPKLIPDDDWDLGLPISPVAASRPQAAPPMPLPGHGGSQPAYQPPPPQPAAYQPPQPAYQPPPPQPAYQPPPPQPAAYQPPQPQPAAYQPPPPQPAAYQPPQPQAPVYQPPQPVQQLPPTPAAFTPPPPAAPPQIAPGPTPFDETGDFGPAIMAAIQTAPPPPPAPLPQAMPQAAPPAPAPRTAEPALGTADLLAMFMGGAGMGTRRPDNPENAMQAIGAAFRATVSGIRQALIARSSIKGEFRIEQTMIRSRGNNPLKFSADDDDALSALLGVGRRMEMKPDAAIADALRDMRLHELATMAAMQGAVRALLAQLDPARLRAEADAGGGMTVLPAQKKARAFEAYEKLHDNVTRALADDFDSVFGKAFARAYETALRDISAKEVP